MDAMTHASIRARLEQRLRREVDDHLWAHLVEREFVSDAVLSKDMGLLVKEARYMEGFLRSAHVGKSLRRPAAAEGGAIAARGRAEGAWAARYARGSKFRGLRNPWLERVHGYLGGVLDPDEAVAHLTSAAWSLLPLVSLIGREDPTRLGPDDTPRILMSTARLMGEADEIRDGRYGVRLNLDVEFDGVRTSTSFWQPATARQLTVEVPERPPVRVVAAADTLNERLLGLATQVRWGPMSVAETLWLILTDKPPDLRPLAVEVALEPGPGLQPRTVITVQAEPWVSVDAVAAAYREVQAECLNGRNRPPRLRALEMARFLASEGFGLRVADQWRLWNATHPAWAVKNRGNFRTEAQRAVAQVLGEHPDRGDG